MGVESATCLSPQGELSRVPPATEHRKGARRAPALEAPGPAPRAPCGAPTTKTKTPRPDNPGAGREPKEAAAYSAAAPSLVSLEAAPSPASSLASASAMARRSASSIASLTLRAW